MEGISGIIFAFACSAKNSGNKARGELLDINTKMSCHTFSIRYEPSRSKMMMTHNERVTKYVGHLRSNLKSHSTTLQIPIVLSHIVYFTLPSSPVVQIFVSVINVATPRGREEIREISRSASPNTVTSDSTARYKVTL